MKLKEVVTILCDSVWLGFSRTRNFEKNCQIFQKVAQTVPELKRPKFESPKLLNKGQSSLIEFGWNFENFHPIFQSIPSSVQAKKGQNIYDKAQFESPKHLNITNFETLKYLLQTMFWNCLVEHVTNLLQQKVAQNITISFGYFVFSKNHNEPPKVAQKAKIRQIWSPCLGCISIFE